MPPDGIPGSLSDWCPDSQMAEPQMDSLEGRTNSPGMATGSGKVPGPGPSQFLLQQLEEETDHLLGAPRKETSEGEMEMENGGTVTDNLGAPRKGATVRNPGDSGEGRHHE